MLQLAAQNPATTIFILLLLIALSYFVYRQLLPGRQATPKPFDHRDEPDPQPNPYQPETASNRDDRQALLKAAASWGYQLQDLTISRAADSPFDILIVDYALDGDDASALTPSQVAGLQRKPDGSRRICLAYLSVGEAESYRSYWRPEWKKQKPHWLLGENPDWEENYAVRFWHKDWQNIIFGSPQAYLDKIIAQGFDGVYLDKCDVYEDLERSYRKVARERPDPAGDMVEFVARLAAHARAKSPGFLLVMQNAEGLLRHDRMRSILDGAAKEELLFGQDGGEKRNEDDDFQYARHHLELIRNDGKPVFVVEYLSNKKKIMEAQKVCGELGFVVAISDPSRDLDRLDFDYAAV